MEEIYTIIRLKKKAKTKRISKKIIVIQKILKLVINLLIK